MLKFILYQYWCLKKGMLFLLRSPDMFCIVFGDSPMLRNPYKYDTSYVQLFDGSYIINDTLFAPGHTTKNFILVPNLSAEQIMLIIQKFVTKQ